MLTTNQTLTLDTCYSENPKDGIYIYWTGTGKYYPMKIIGDNNNEDQKLYRGAYYLKPTITEDDSIRTIKWTPSWFFIDPSYDAHFRERVCNATGFNSNSKVIRLLVEPFTQEMILYPLNKYW